MGFFGGALLFGFICFIMGNCFRKRIDTINPPVQKILPPVAETIQSPRFVFFPSILNCIGKVWDTIIF